MSRYLKAALDQAPTGATDFLLIFLRFEFALKAAGMVRPEGGAEVSLKRKTARAKANWDEFTSYLGAEKYEEVTRRNLFPEIRREPPRHQNCRVDGDRDPQIDWQVSGPIRSMVDLVGAVRRVRNNVVHGGKSGDPDADRHSVLIQDAQSFLLWALDQHEDLRLKFLG